MAQNFTWKAASERAAALVAAGNLSDFDVAQQVGVSRRTLARWKEEPEFGQRVTDLVKIAREEAKKYAISDKDARVGATNKRWLIVQEIVMEQLENYAARYRAVDENEAAQTEAGVAKDKSAEEIVGVDADLLREARQLEEHAARLLGQWSDKHEHSGTGSKGPIPVIVIPSIIPLSEGSQVLKRKENYVPDNECNPKCAADG